jgi:predicted esterase
MAYILDKYIYAPPELYTYPDRLYDDGIDGNVNTDLVTNVFDRSKVPCLQSDTDGEKCLVLFFHGNNEHLPNLGWYLNLLAEYYDGTSIAMEYPGYARNYGDCSTAKTFECAEKFTAACIRQEMLTRQRPIILVGYSLGCAIALHVADVHRNDSFPHGIQIIAPFYSALSVVLARSNFGLYFTSLYYLLDAMCAKTPVLRQGHRIAIAHGGSDEVIPVTHGRSLAKIAYVHDRKLSQYTEVPEASHSSIRLFEDIYIDAAKLFGLKV